MAGTLPDRALESACEEIELIRTTDHGRLEVTLDGKRSRPEREQPQGLNRFRLALQRECLAGLDLGRVTREAVGLAADQDLSRLGGLLQTGGDVDRIARC